MYISPWKPRPGQAMSAARPQETEMLVWLDSPSGVREIESYGEGAITVFQHQLVARAIRNIVVASTATDFRLLFASQVSALSAHLTRWRNLQLLAVSSPRVSGVACIRTRRRNNTGLRDGAAAGFFSAAKPNLRNAP